MSIVQSAQNGSMYVHVVKCRLINCMYSTTALCQLSFLFVYYVGHQRDTQDSCLDVCSECPLGVYHTYFD